MLGADPVNRATEMREDESRCVDSMVYGGTGGRDSHASKRVVETGRDGGRHRRGTGGCLPSPEGDGQAGRRDRAGQRQ